MTLINKKRRLEDIGDIGSHRLLQGKLYNGITTLQSILTSQIPTDEFDIVHYIKALYIITSRVIIAGFEKEKINLSDKRILVLIHKCITICCNRLLQFSLTNELILRKYKVSIADRKWSPSTSFFICRCNLYVIKKKLPSLENKTDNNNNESNTIKELKLFYNEMKKKYLFIFNKEISKFDQKELILQIKLLAKTWRQLECTPFIQMILDKIFSRITDLCTTMGPRSILNAKKKYVYEMSSNLYSVSSDFIDEMSCYIEDFEIGMNVYNFILKQEKVTDINSFAKEIGYDLPSLVENFKSWVKKESDIISDDLFKDKVIEVCIHTSLSPGEYKIYTKQSGVETKNGVTIIENTRTPLQCEWWCTKSIGRGKGMKITKSSPTIYSTIMCLIFNSYCESTCRFPFHKNALIMEKDFIETYGEFVLSKEPIILQCIGEYFVNYNGYIFFTKNIETSIIIWLILMEMKSEGKETIFEGCQLESWDIKPIVQLLENSLIDKDTNDNNENVFSNKKRSNIKESKPRTNGNVFYIPVQ